MKWTSLKYKFPEIGEEVWVSTEETVQYVTYSWDGDIWIPYYSDYGMESVLADSFTHWQPLPPPPNNPKEKE